MLSILLPKLNAPLRSSLSLIGVATARPRRIGRAISSQGFSSTFATKGSTTPLSLPLDVPIEEELIPGYNPNYFYHPHPGDILDGRYELSAKLGFGSTSTVWLARDKEMEDRSYVAIKICTSNVHDEAASEHELRMSKHIVQCAQGDESKYLQLRTIKDSFSVKGTHGTHSCLVMEPMREPIWLTRRRLTKTSRATPATMVIFKMFLQDLVAGLKYLHQCNIIHTDLKVDNFMLGFEAQSVINSFADAQFDHPMPRKVFPTHTVYLSHNDFGLLRKTTDEHPILIMVPKIVDFGLAQRGDTTGGEPLLFPIQVNQFHAPEVLLGTGWSYSADIWNLGVMIWDLLAGKDLFQNIYDERGVYNAKHHLADMYSILGPIPIELIQREKEMRHWRWHPEIKNANGKLCNNAADFFGGPFINDGTSFIIQIGIRLPGLMIANADHGPVDSAFFVGSSSLKPRDTCMVFCAHGHSTTGTFAGLDLVKPYRSLEELLPDCITEEDKADFVDFMSGVLCWLPELRMSAEELLHHPWLTRWCTPTDGQSGS